MSTKSDLAEEIAQLLGMDASYIRDLQKAQKDGLIAVRNCAKKLVKDKATAEERIAELEAEIIDLKASITK